MERGTSLGCHWVSITSRLVMEKIDQLIQKLGAEILNWPESKDKTKALIALGECHSFVRAQAAKRKIKWKVVTSIGNK